MKLTHILVPVLTFALGWLAVSVIRGGSDDSDLEAQLAQAQAEIAELKSRSSQMRPEPEKLTSLPRAVVETTAKEPEPTVVESEEVEPLTEETAEAALANLLNSKEARIMIKGLTSGIAEEGEQWIEGELAKYTESLNLTDDQVARLKERLTKNLEEQAAEFTAQLDDENISMEEIFEQQTGDAGPDDMIAEIMKEELSEEQYAQFERQQLEERTERVQRDADRQLQRLDRDLELSDLQKDQVFGILVQTNREFDDSMAIEVAGAGGTIEEGQTQDDAIRAVLDPEQAEKFDESRDRLRRGFGGFGGFGQ